MQNFAMALKAVLIGSELFPEAGSDQDIRHPTNCRLYHVHVHGPVETFAFDFYL